MVFECQVRESWSRVTYPVVERHDVGAGVVQGDASPIGGAAHVLEPFCRHDGVQAGGGSSSVGSAAARRRCGARHRAGLGGSNEGGLTSRAPPRPIAESECSS